ncbi:MAG: hypothetical protein JEY96_10315 [Bacteroidales bacterium]|nr:hypothetical protein [Bacteroidales bacterium]
MMNNIFSKNRLSLYVVLFSIFVYVWTVFNISSWERNKVIIHDIISYYSYLPATFIYHDLSFEFTDDLTDEVKSKIWYLKDPNGARVQKMSMGLSIMYSPFFLIAHQIAKFFGIPATGYSWIYSLFLVLSSLFYFFVSLIFLRKILLRFFDDKSTALTLLILAFGTNILFYVTNESPMSHSYNFFLFVLMIYQTLKWHDNPTFKMAFYIGIISGLITIVRPSNIIILLIPLFYGIWNKETFIQKLQVLIQKWYQVLIILALTVLIFSPQMFYWKHITGDYWYYSYGDEGFFFLSPKIFKGLFSFRKGWLIYTPVMIFAIAGIPLMFRQLKNFAVPVSLFFVLNIYIVFSWWCWWYGGSFGMRSLIESYAVLSIPLALFIKNAFQKKRLLKISTIVLMFLLISLNTFQTLQYRRTVIHWDSMTKEAYFAVFGKLKFPENYQDLIESPDYRSAKKGEPEKAE